LAAVVRTPRGAVAAPVAAPAAAQRREWLVGIAAVVPTPDGAGRWVHRWLTRPVVLVDVDASVVANHVIAYGRNPLVVSGVARAKAVPAGRWPR
jgi:hypothetical protein